MNVSSFHYRKSLLMIGIFFLALCSQSAAQTPAETHQAIEAALNNYLNGSSYNRPEQIKSAFYAESDMFLHHSEKPIYRMNSLKYADLFEKRERNIFNGRFGKILDIDVSGNIATAKAEILMPKIEARFIDIFVLKKLEDEWKIISKAADRAESARSGKRILLMAARASRGERFSDLIDAYEIAAEAGYTIDIVSPDGGAVSFKKVAMRNPKHKAYLYDADFMYALKHSLQPKQVRANDYVLAKYIGKGRALNNADMKTLYSNICGQDNTCVN